jgi:hypothetical protein
MKPRIILKLENFDPKTTFVLIGKRYDFETVDFDSLGVLRKILGNVIFSYSPITDLGNLTTIGGDADFRDSQVKNLGNLTTIGVDAYFNDSQITDLANLTTIGGGVNFKGSQITDLGNLTTIGGDAYFDGSIITDLGNLKTIDGGANFLGSKIKNLGNLTTIGGDADFNGSFIKDLGNLQTIGGYADFSFSKITDLGNLETIEGNVDFEDSKVKYLGNLKRIGGNANFKDSPITDLGNLETIDGSVDFEDSKVKYLGNLQSIGHNAYFQESKITDLGNLTTIGGYANFKNSEIIDLGNLTTIESDADFRYSKVKNLGNLTTIGGYADFKDSPITDLGNLTTIGGNAYFQDSQITDLGNLTTIEGDAYFEDSEIIDLGNLQTIGGRAYFGDKEDLKEKWERRQNKYKKGGRTISQTPAPKKDQIKGSDKNKAGSSKDTESAKQIKFNEKTLNSIQNKVDEHNKQYPNKKITLESAKAVVRRGMGAYSQTYRPTISGGKPNSRVAWGLARLNAFIYKIINGKSKSGKYSQDNDLIEELGYKIQKYEIGGIFQGTPHDFDKYSTEYMGTGEGVQAFGWGLYFTNIKDIAKNYAKNQKLIQKEISRKSDNSAHLWIYTNISANVVDKLGYLKIKLKEFEELKNEYKKDTWDDKIETYSTLIDIIQNYQGKIYSVTLFKGEKESDYDLLEWEKKPKKSQLDLIKKQLDKEGIIVKRDLGIGKEYRFKGEALDKIFNQQETHYTGGTKNSNLYTELSAFLGGDKEASLFLLRAGIDGIKYKAGTLSGMEDEEGYNYVIFDADDVTIEGKEKYADGGEINQNMKNEIIDILSKNARYGTKIFDLQEVGLKVIQNCIESNTYFGNAIKQANENYIMIPVKYDDKLWAIDKKVEYVYYAKPNQNTKIRVEYKYDMQDYPTPVLFDSETMNNEEFHDVNDYEEINVEEFDSEFLYRGINNNEMLSIIENGFIKSNASMNIGEQQENTTSFAQHISQASSYAVGFNAWFDEVTFAKPKYILKVKKEGVNYKPTIETDVENEVDVFGEIPIQQIESIYEIKLGECQMGMVEINVGYKNDFSDGSRFPMFKKVFVRKTDINSLINENKSKNKIEKNREHLPNNFFSDGVLIAPNGKPSNLTPEQYELVRTPEFKAWFGDWENDPENASKVVDENGEPKVMYHSSDSEFTIFNPEHKSRWINQRKEKAIWFGGNNKVSSYTNNGYLYEVFLYCFNPIIVDAKDYDSWNYYYDEKNNKTYDIGRIKGRFVTQAKEVKWDGTANNNDGVLFFNAWDNVPLGIVCVVFEPNQIKLANGTNTTFDNNNPDIRYTGGGLMKRRSRKRNQ